MPRQKLVSDAAKSSVLYLDETEYKYAIDGMMAQGIEHAEAVETLKVGMRQANGRAVPHELSEYALHSMVAMA